MKEPEGLVRATWMKKAAKYGGNVSYGSAIVEALRDAGWLREANEIPVIVALNGYKRTVETLKRDLAAATKERDEARRTRTIEFNKRREAEAERDEARSCVAASNKTIAAWQNDYYDAKSREASPAMLRVVEAGRRLVAWWHSIGCEPDRRAWLTGEQKLFADAVDALAAPAVEKPRYEARQFELAWGVWDAKHNSWLLAHGWDHALTQQQAERIAAVLNDAEAAR